MSKPLTVSAFSTLPPGPAPSTDRLDQVIRFWREQIDQVLPDRPDLIVLPENCDRGNDPAARADYAEFRERRGARFRDALAEIARKNRCFITCSTARKADDGTWRNSIELLDRNGETAGIYDKNHLVVTEIEHGIHPGTSAPVFETELGRIGCAICFDLNFDELRRQYERQKPDLILFSSMYHGGLMQAVWAYTCRAHFIGAIGDLPSTVLSPVGHQIAVSTNYFHRVTTRINLDCAVVHLDFHWKKLEAIKARYGREVDIFDPGLLAPVLITSQSDQRTIGDLMAEFEMEPIDAYFDRSRAARDAAIESTSASG